MCQDAADKRDEVGTKMLGIQNHRRLLRAGSVSLDRVGSFSDGVFAIVVTLLVLGIRVPTLDGPGVSNQLVHALAAMAPNFLVYALSFAIVCIWWVAHTHLLAILVRADRGFVWFNCLFLLCLAFIPFPTALLGRYPGQAVAVIAYALATTAAGLSFAWMRYYSFFIAHLIRKSIARDLLRSAMLKSTMNPILHLIAATLALVNTNAAMAVIVLAPIVFLIPTRLEISEGD